MGIFREGACNAVATRLLGYWVLTYGAIRIAAGWYNCAPVLLLALVSYCIECNAYFAEDCMYHSVVSWRARFVYVACIFIILQIGKSHVAIV